MKISCGVDIIEIDRVKESIEQLGDKFLNRVFTDKEIEYCESRKIKNINIMLQDLLLKKLHLKLFQGK